MRTRPVILSLIALLCIANNLSGATLEEQLLNESPATLGKDAVEQGDPQRGAVVFYQPFMACTKCHSADDAAQQLGPDLSQLKKTTTNAELVTSLLKPSAVIAEKYQVVNLLTDDGKKITGLIAEATEDQLVIRDAAHNFKAVSIAKESIEAQSASKTSLMPAGQVNALASRQQFLDLVSYLAALRDGGSKAAKKLRPPAAMFAARPLPEYESHIDHAGLIAALDQPHLERGAAIYNRLCINCHGDLKKPGSLPTSLRFASGKFKNGSDPHTMYQTLTRGFGMMVGQSWMVPQQKYDVIHYIREVYLKRHNPTQYFDVNDDYLASLPAGDTFGPAPSKYQPWERMDYGPNLIATYEIGKDGANFAYKGNAIRLDAGAGGVTRGRHWMIYDTDTMRVAAGYSGKGFIDYNGINFNGKHGTHPRIVGDVAFQNPTGPGWAKPTTNADATPDFTDPRMRGRDDRAYGPLPKSWAQYRGMYAHGADTIIRYTVGNTDVLESPSINTDGDSPVFVRTINIAAHSEPLVLRVARTDKQTELKLADDGAAAVLASTVSTGVPFPTATKAIDTREVDGFNGGKYVEFAGKPFASKSGDYTIAAHIKTESDGSIFTKTVAGPKWVPNGQSLFIRGGRLVFDIGWVGAVQSKVTVADGKWHHVAVSYQAKTGDVVLYVDGKVAGEGRLELEGKLADPIVRIGYTSPNFPSKNSHFRGVIERIAYYDAVITPKESKDAKFISQWRLNSLTDESVVSKVGAKIAGKIVSDKLLGRRNAEPVRLVTLAAGYVGNVKNATWSRDDDSRDLLLTIPASEKPQRFSLWQTRLNKADDIDGLLASLVIDQPARDLEQLTSGGPTRWPDVLTTQATIGSTDGPFAVDNLTLPEQNPWFCRLRTTGLDFFEDGDTAAVSTWDGEVWLVKGLMGLEAAAKAGEPTAPITWRRIATGLFQPLGVKIVNGEIFITCRDQLCRLHDLNGDEEIDFYESFNNDHQVTDHFHEFAMGLQTDKEGNFYYAKSARHALKALVPHHGTLLKITPDGKTTEIVANGFRAANGVCVNPDGTFIVTDQEGHWNPKNRINWVEPGGFYGNMFGYHDVTDSSDSAMQQPLCWITNKFDRSPAELLWVDSERWGALNGKLLNLSYGYGKVYVVPHEDVNGQKQGGMCELPIPQFDTGVMRGRFHPGDGQLYLTGMFAWAGNQQEKGGVYRLRRTSEPVHLPTELSATTKGVELGFSGPLDREAAESLDNYQVKVWSLKRTASYGSKHYDEHMLKVTGAKLSDDKQTVELTLPEIEPTWCMEIQYDLKSAAGKSIEGVIHNTIHKLNDK